MNFRNGFKVRACDREREIPSRMPEDIDDGAGRPNGGGLPILRRWMAARVANRRPMK